MCRSSLSLNIKVNTEREEQAVKLDSPVASLVKKKVTFLTQLHCTTANFTPQSTSTPLKASQPTPFRLTEENPKSSFKVKALT